VSLVKDPEFTRPTIGYTSLGQAGNLLSKDRLFATINHMPLQSAPMTHHESDANRPDAHLVNRILFFSDAVFAIVLTIMALELHAPLITASGLASMLDDQTLWAALANMVPVWFAYVTSFALVGMWWVIHLRVMRSLRTFDLVTAIWNLLFMLVVSAIPFVSSMLGQNMSVALAWALYWSANALAALFLTVLFFVISRDEGRLIGGIKPLERLTRLLSSIGPGLAFAAGAAMAFAGKIHMSQMCWILIPVFATFAAQLRPRRKPLAGPDDEAGTPVG